MFSEDENTPKTWESSKDNNETVSREVIKENAW